MEHQCRIVLKIQFLAIFMEVQNNLLGLGKVVIVTGPCHPRNHDDYRTVTFSADYIILETGQLVN